MTRIIKFRAWDRKEKRFIDSVFSSLQLKTGEPDVPHVAKEDVVLMQFTGLLDKNGKEIYEGDILIVRELHDGDEWCWNNTEQKAIPQVVSWDEERLCFDFAGCSRVKYSPNHFEVIGNIYENPELFK